MTNVNFTSLYSSNLLEIFYDEASGILKNTWKTTLISMEEVQTEMAAWMQKFEEKKPKLLLTNNQIGQILLPEIQAWIGGFLFPKITNLGATRWAIVLSGDLFSNISVVQMIDESNKPLDVFAQRLFETNENEAIDWLMTFK